jgi:hypothetical protein
MAFMEVVPLPNGRYAVKTTGGTTLQTPVEFETQAEAEEYLIRQAPTINEPHILRPGGSGNVS